MSQPQRSIVEVLMAGCMSKRGLTPSSGSNSGKRKVIAHRQQIDNRLKKVCDSGFDSEEVTMKLKTAAHMLKKSPRDFDPRCMIDCWDGQKKTNMIPFAFMCLACDLISEEQGKRTCIREIACNMLRTVMYSSSSKDLLAVLCLLTYKLAPAHQVGVSDQLGIGEDCLIKSVSEAYGMVEAKVKSKTKESGDLGLVAESGSARFNKLKFAKHKGLTVSKVYDTFCLIAEESGKSSKNRKKDLVKELLVAAHDSEAKYLIRLLLPKRGMQIKCAESTFLDALGQAAVYFEKQSPPTMEEASKIVRQAYAVVPVFEKIVTVLMSEGLRKLQETCRLSPGIPIGPMLAKAVPSVFAVEEKFKGINYTCEYKYDGERGQVHYMSEDTERVEIYSRNLERSTEKFPDVVETVFRLKNPHVKSFILDCEIVAYDRDRHRVLPFQELSTRGRKNVKVDNIKVEACVFAFDLLYLNGESLVQEPLAERRKHLYSAFAEEAGFLQFPTSITSSDPDAVQRFFQNSVHESFEGLVVKSLNVDAEYEPGKRKWLKLKKDSVESLWDSLDLVPIGAFFGKGKRTGVYGTFLLACYDCNSGEFQSICKAGTGISDALLEDRYEHLSSKVILKPLPNYRYDAQKVAPDVWFEPTEVWEVKAGGLTISSVYSAAYGIVCPDKGLSLRHPCIHRIRLDKHPMQATTSCQVAEMYHEQGQKLG